MIRWAPLWGAVSVLDTRVHFWEDVIQGIDNVVCARILQLVIAQVAADVVTGSSHMPTSSQGNTPSRQSLNPFLTGFGSVMTLGWPPDARENITKSENLVVE